MLTLVVVGVVLSIAVKTRQMWRRWPREKFIIIIDGGSTGTRMNVFVSDESDPNLRLTAIPPEAASEAVPYRPGIRAYHRVETLPGLQTIAIDALGEMQNATRLYEDINQKAMQPLLKWAKAVIPKETQETTPIRLLATAGVRGMTVEQQEALLDALEAVLTHSGFRYDSGGIEIMSGHQEGVLGWVALNHELGTFNNSTMRAAPNALNSLHGNRFFPQIFGAAKRTNPSYIPFPASPIIQEGKRPDSQPDTKLGNVSSLSHLATAKLIGALDMGGSSMEVTLPASHPTSTALQISDHEYWLESVTFEKLGLNKAFQASLRLAASNGSSQLPSSVEHPCLHAGYSEETKILRSQNQSDTEDSIEVKLIGKPSWHDCKGLAKEVVLSLIHCNQSTCFDASDDQLASMPVAGLSGFYVIAKFFELENGFNLSQLESKGQEFCNQSWRSIQEHMHDVIHVDKYCFRSAFVSELLQTLFGYDQSRTMYIAAESVSWPLGAAVLHIDHSSRQLPSPKSANRRFGPQQHDSDETPYSIVIYLMAFVGAVLLSYACLRAFRRRADRDIYGDLDPSYGGPRNTFSNLQGRSHEIKRRTFSYRRLPELSIS